MQKSKCKIMKSRLGGTTIIFILLSAFLFFPGPAFAVQGPAANPLYPFNDAGLSAQAYAVMDQESGEMLLEKNAQSPWVPASLTKLVTAMVALDENPDFSAIVKMQKADEVGGARIATAPGVKYYLNDLFYASLVASANNATNALARSVGLKVADFIQKMDDKAKSLGAFNTNFVEPAGISPQNMTTAEDYAKILRAALVYPKIQEAVTKPGYTFQSVNYRRYRHNLKNTDRLLDDGSLIVTGGKTGYLEESGYNFAAELRDVDGKNIVVVLFGSKNHQTQFFETKQLAVWVWVNYKWPKVQPQVAGAFVGLKMPDEFAK
jgi:D-alanyl-D-alanine carboxypeptidase